MKLFRSMSIGRKMTLITMLTCSLALVLTCLAFALHERRDIKADMGGSLSILALVMGENASAALSFRDQVSAEQTLRSLRAVPSITAAALYDAEGELFATYTREKELFAAPSITFEGVQWERDQVRVFHRIDVVGENAGTIYLQASVAEMYAVLWRVGAIMGIVVLAASLVAFLLSNRLQASISGPISRLAKVVGAVAAEQDYSVRVTRQGDGELGRLIDGFNEMMAQIQSQDQALREAGESLEQRVAERQHAEAELEKIHKQLLEASRRGGMAEVATNVLHNVGNVLNSVNVSASLVSEGLKKPRAPGLARVVALMKEHEGDLAAFITSDERGRHLPIYLGQLSAQLAVDQDRAREELESLRANIEHIKDIVAMQQSYAKLSGVKEIVNITDLVEDSLRMNVGALSRHGVELVREYADLPPIELDKHRVLQILVNLVRNAKYACDESGRADKRLTLRVTGDEVRLRIEVIDNGIGIAAENLTRIFSYGFTTRELGHGFGLHSAALAAIELGGSLTATSEGLGRGATFTLEMPLNTLEGVECAA